MTKTDKVMGVLGVMGEGAAKGITVFGVCLGATYLLNAGVSFVAANIGLFLPALVAGGPLTVFISWLLVAAAFGIALEFLTKVI
jgi:hypothetical protein